MPLIHIVDEDDNIITYKERWTLGSEDIYRVSALWVTNPQGEILIAQRHRSKKHHPLLWWPAVCGTVEKGETYLENIIRETEEEIGIRSILPATWPKTQTRSGYLHFTQWFTITLDLPLTAFTPQADEIETIKWISSESLSKEFRDTPENFVPSFSLILPLFL